MVKRDITRINHSLGELTISHASGTAALRESEEAWRSLFRDSNCKSLFLDYDWMRIWWESEQGSSTLEIFEIRLQGKLIGLAPMMRRPQNFGRYRYFDLFFLSAFEDPFSERAVSGSLDILWLPEYDNLKIEFAEYLLTQTHSWCYLRLNPIPQESTTINAFREAAKKLGLEVKSPWVLKNAVLNIRGSWDDYYSGLSSKFRKNIRRFQRNSAVGNDVEYIENRTEDEVENALREVLQVEKHSWKKERGFQIDDKSLSDFYFNIARFFAKQNRVRLWILKVNSEPVAYDLHVECEGHVKTLKGSYSDSAANFSPGTLLTQASMKKFFTDELKQVDLLWGSLHYKEKWTNLLHVHHGIYLRRPGFIPSLVQNIYRSHRLHRFVGLKKTENSDKAKS